MLTIKTFKTIETDTVTYKDNGDCVLIRRSEPGFASQSILVTLQEARLIRRDLTDVLKAVDEKELTK